VLSSARNPKVAGAARLRKRAFRERDRRFLVEGAQGVGEGLEAGALETLFVLDPHDPLAVRARQAGVDVHHVSEDLLRRLAATVTPQGVLGVARFVDVDLEELPAEGCLALLHEVRDPGNAGTVIRSADAAGASGVVVSTRSVDVYNPKTVRATAGSVFHLPIVREVPTEDAIRRLRGEGVRVLAMDGRGDRDLYGIDLGGPVAFCFGNEAHGLPEEIRALADAVVRVPHAGKAESLNLAAAATVCLFEWARRAHRSAEALETLIAAAAHDLRSPLTAMKGFGYALERHADRMEPEQRAMMLTGIVHDADRMDTILRQLVDAARLVGGSFEVYREQTDLSELVHQIAEQQARDPEHPPIRWSGEAGPFLIDPARMRTTVLAFAESLVWWTEEGPIEVGAKRRGARLHLWASRSGARVSAEEAEGLFRPRRPGTGAGSKMGLYVARGVAEAQGGRAWAEVADGVLSFHVELPLPERVAVREAADG
jgi:TrmH family RNA methyltransferase